MSNDEQEQLDIPVWLRCILTAIGALLLLGASISLVLFVNNSEKFPSPKDLDSSFLFALGVGLLLVLYVPWQRIKVGGVEIERRVQEIASDYSHLPCEPGAPRW